MARLFNGTNDSIEAASTLVTDAPLTMACWFYPVSSIGMVLMTVDTASGIDRFQIGTVPGTFPASCAAVQGGSAQIGSVAVSGTSGVVSEVTVTFTLAQLPTSLAAGDQIRVRVQRNTAVSGNHAGDAELLGLYANMTPVIP